MTRKGAKKALAGALRPAVVEVVKAASTARTNRNRRRRERLRERLAESRIGGVEEKMEAMSLAGAGVKFRRSGLGKELTSRTEEFGSASTHDGAIWLCKTLDPCHPEGAVLGVPDTVSCNVVSPQYTTVDALVSPFNATEATWSFVEIVDFSIGSIYRLSYQGDIGSVAPANAFAFTTQLPGAAEVFRAQGYAASRLTYAGVTYDFSGAALSDQGRQVAVQLTPEWKDAGQQSDPDTGALLYTQYLWPWGNGANFGTNVPGLAAFLKNLAESDPKSYSDAAKRGAYFPIRNTNPFRFKDHSSDTTGTSVTIPYKVYKNPLSVAAGVPVQGGATPPNTALSEPWDMGASIYWVTGIDNKTSFQRTVRYGFEVQIEPDSPFRVFGHTSPLYDRLAMETATDIGTTLSSAYPAEYNFLGGLWKGIKKVASGIGKVIGVAKPVYNAVGPALGMPALPF